MTMQTRVSAIDTLKALANKKPAFQTPALSAQVSDPAISGAKMEKNTVKLGFDPDFTGKAREGAALKLVLEQAQAEFDIIQSEIRDYGRDKRKVYNTAFKANVTTVCVPYSIETPTGPETKYVQVICSNKYSVQKEMILNNQEAFGEWFERLFHVETVKKLKPNAEDLVRNLLSEMGISGDELEAAMVSLFDTETKVTTKDSFEQESAKAPPHVQVIVDQAVSRSQPGLKFP